MPRHLLSLRRAQVLNGESRGRVVSAIGKRHHPLGDVGLTVHAEVVEAVRDESISPIDRVVVPEPDTRAGPAADVTRHDVVKAAYAFDPVLTASNRDGAMEIEIREQT